MPRVAAQAVVALALAAACSASCASDRDCSFAGTCKNGVCNCTSGFTGDTCHLIVNGTIPVASGFRLEDFHVWGAQVLYNNKDGLYHMLASIYPANLEFDSHWLVDAQIAHAVAPTPAGPFTMTGIALAYTTVHPLSAPQPWDRSVMNPKLVRATEADGGGFLLFYTGDTYTGPTPNSTTPAPVNQSMNAIQASQRVGVAYSSTIAGPYERIGQPALLPRAGKWDSRITTNPAVTRMANGSGYLMVYKASNPAQPQKRQAQVCLGLAAATSFRGPWNRVVDDPILPCPAGSFDFEDPSLYYDPVNEVYRLIVKDFHGTVTHDGYSGAHAVSTDGVHFGFVAEPLAYTTTHLWSDGVVRTQNRQERCQPLLAEDGTTLLGMYYATDTELDGSKRKTWCMWVPAAFQ